MIIRNLHWLVLLTMMIIAGWSTASDAQPMATETGDHCKDDAIEFMEKNFGDVLTFNHWEKDTKSGPNPYAPVVFVVHVSECSGVFVVETGNSAFCQLPHYGGQPTSYVRRVHATGDCKKFLSKDMSRNEGR